MRYSLFDVENDAISYMQEVQAAVNANSAAARAALGQPIGRKIIIAVFPALGKRAIMRVINPGVIRGVDVGSVEPSVEIIE